jgi:L-seryl-tRNA(Ser) seleniumtransferase
MAVAVIIGAEVGGDTIPEVVLTMPSAPGVSHRFTSLVAYTTEVANARIYAGFHYRNSTVVGQEMGRQWCVDLGALQSRASELIAEATGAEAGYVTAGAAAALMLGTWACLAGFDPARMSRLPDTAGMPNEVIIARSQRNMYDHAAAQAGARIIEVGIPDRFSGAGMRDAQIWEYESATDGGHSVRGPRPCRAAAAADRRPGAPASGTGVRRCRAQLPPAGNLKRFIAEGADLVAFSGGKALGGPQACGILAGRRDLIQSAELQQLDHDTYFEQWSAPASLFDKSKLVGLPVSGIGRAAKCGKEEIVGLLTALRIFLEQDRDWVYERWLVVCREIVVGLQDIPGTAVTLIKSNSKHLPEVHLKVDRDRLGFVAAELIKRLQDGNPSVHVNHERMRESVIVLGPICLKSGDLEVLIKRMRTVLSDIGPAKVRRRPRASEDRHSGNRDIEPQVCLRWSKKRACLSAHSASPAASQVTPANVMTRRAEH